MTSLPSAPAAAPAAASAPGSLPMDGLGNSPTPRKDLGAFEAPKPADGGAAAAGQSPAKPQTDHLALNVGTGATKPAAAPIEIPKDAQFSKPVAVVKASNPSSDPERAVVTYVDDGDTAKLKRADGSQVNCRIDGIDAPETAKPKYNKAGQPFGEESKRILQDMIDRKEVTVQVSYAQDKHGRNICQIDIAGKNVSQEMVRSGAAWLYTQYNKNPTLAGMEAEARAAHRGQWAAGNAIPPWQFRQMQKYGQ